MKRLLVAAVAIALVAPAMAGSLDSYSKSDREMFALAAVLTINYARCGGHVTPDQWEAVSPILHDLGAEVAGIARVVERENCPTLKRAYLSMRAAARQTFGW